MRIRQRNDAENQQMPIDFEQQINERHQKVVRLARQGEYDRALAMAHETHVAVRNYWSNSHFRVAHSLHLLAELYRALGAYQFAEPYYLDALNVYQALRVPADSEAVRRLHDLACFLADEAGYSVDTDDPLYQSGVLPKKWSRWYESL
jgi:hypothetical protein